MTLTDLCKELNNWFVTSIHHDNFTIKNGEINLADMVVDGSLQNGQYFRIVGSVFNDGVHSTLQPNWTMRHSLAQCGQWLCRESLSPC